MHFDDTVDSKIPELPNISTQQHNTLCKVQIGWHITSIAMMQRAVYTNHNNQSATVDGDMHGQIALTTWYSLHLNASRYT